jgi:hypothetical protein
MKSSSSDAELLAVSRGTKDTYWWRRLFTAIGLDIGSDSRVVNGFFIMRQRTVSQFTYQARTGIES